MENVYVHVKNGLPINEDVQKAIDGFEYLGYEPVLVTMENMLSGTLDYVARFHPVVGSIDFMTRLFKRLAMLPEPIDYPDEIVDGGLMHRFIIQTSIKNILYDIDRGDNDNISIFVKPLRTKLFDGVLITKKEHTSYLKGFDENTPIWAAAPIDIISEHRIYVHNGKAIYGCNYSGDFRLNPDYTYIDKLIAAYKSAPKSYTIDIGILRGGTNTVVEVNDFWAIGGYGLAPWDYAEMLIDRYLEIINK
jgi:hypothetical protein